MRRLLMAFLLVALHGTASADPRADPEAAIAGVLDELHASAAAADAARYFALYARDAVFIGTDATERWTLEQFRTYAAPQFAAGRGWVYHPRERHITLLDIPCACVAWFDELLDSESYGTSRGTGVLVREEGAWKIARYSLGFPIPNDLAAALTARIRSFEAAAADN